MVFAIILASLAAVSLGLGFWQLLVAARFPLHRRLVPAGAAADVSILKPLKGSDVETAGCLRSWLTQHYPGSVEVLFGVAAEEDPVCELVRRLIQSHPECPARLIICGERRGPNAKVCILAQLERVARFDLLCVSDADVLVPADFLANVVAELNDSAAGLVNCFYRYASAASFAVRWEAFAVNADFWSQVLQARSLGPLKFALGAAMLLRRDKLNEIGGFTTLEDYLADDYQLGRRLAGAGSRIVLGTLVPECRSAPLRFREVWAHQLRWARTIRVCQPWSYFLSILSNATLWPLLWLVFRPSMVALAGVGVCLGFRMASGFLLEKWLTRKPDVASCWLAPVKDLLQVGIWAAAFSGNQVVWHGERFRVRQGGHFVRIEPRLKTAHPGSCAPRGVAR